VDFLGWIKREKRRARKLVFNLHSTPSEPEGAELENDDPTEDKDAIVGDIDTSGPPST
jgi:hypothetical protein